MYKAIDVAKAVTIHSEKEGYLLNSDKLMYILFFMQEYWIVNGKGLLFEDEMKVESGRLVIPDIREQFGRYGICDLTGDMFGECSPLSPEDETLAVKAADVLSAANAGYLKFSLAKTSIWSDAKKSPNHIITPESVTEFFMIKEKSSEARSKYLHFIGNARPLHRRHRKPPAEIAAEAAAEEK